MVTKAPGENIKAQAEVKKPALDTTQAKLDKLQQDLEWEKNTEKKKAIREEILSIRRSFNRTKQYTEIASLKLAEGKNNLDSISAADLMRIDKEVSKDKRGEFLSKSFLYKRTQDAEGNTFEEPSDGKNLKEGDMLYVDFGGNKSANDRIGLGHMLGANIEYVSVNWKIGVRSIINNRVGYYTENSARWYIPVFNGDQVTLPKASEIQKFTEETKQSGIVKNTDQQASDSANDAYITKLEHTSIEAVEINANVQESYNFWKSKGFSHEQAAGIVANEQKESSCNPKAVWDSGAAHWIFQWHDPRRSSIETQFGKKVLEMTHVQQLEAAYWEMTQTSESKVMEPLKSAKTAREAGAIFSKIYERPANEIGEMNSRGEMAEAFAMLLDTEWRSANLGDHVVKEWPTGGKTDSCGAAVRELLKSYGVTGLPESGAHGKKWEEILNNRPDQFIKMKISHPDQAYPGAILVYDGSGELWSDANKENGHVEIKGSDGKYYSYYKWERAAGSAKTNEKNPEKYVGLTGFIGYAYYPKQKQA